MEDCEDGKVMIYELTERDPDTAYYDSWLWLPKKLVSLDTLRSSLEIPIGGRGAQVETLQLWRDAPHHIGVPRESVPLDSIKCPLVEIIPEFPTTNTRSKITLDYIKPDRDDQVRAFDDLIHSRGGILNLACGAGKTVVFLHAIAEWSIPALVINDKGHILNQWREEIESKLVIDGGIGMVQGPPRKWDWKHPIALASLRSLAKYANEVPPQMVRHFGVVIWDEIHHLSAPMFSQSAAIFPGMRFGATATPKRNDGSQFVYMAHVGKIIHCNMHQDIIPIVTFARSPTSIDLDSAEAKAAVCDVRGDIHMRRLAAYVGQKESEINFVRQLIREAVDDGRKILALSMSVDHLKAMHEQFPQSVLITKDVKVNDRLPLIRSSQLIFGTTDLAQEALNEKQLDSLVILSEFSSENTLQQAVGRIQRSAKKKVPQVVVIWHAHVRGLRAMGNKLRSHFRKWGFKVQER